jgi:hypothetical protein
MGQTLIGTIKQTDGVVLGVELDKGDDLTPKTVFDYTIQWRLDKEIVTQCVPISF